MKATDLSADAGRALSLAIIGAGMAGLSCAGQLVASGHAVTLFDKGRGPGGRMSTRRINTPFGEVAFDHGAQYFTVRDPDFLAQVAIWSARSVVAPWPAAGPDAWVAVPGMNSVVRDMGAGLDVRFGWHVVGLKRRFERWWVACDAETVGPFDGIILAVPAEQAVALLSLHDFEMARTALAARSEPCWTGMFAFRDPLPVSSHIVRGTGAVAWAARNSSKPGRTGPESWVVQADGPWSAAHLERSPAEIASLLCHGLGAALRLAMPEPLVGEAHRWRFARSAVADIGSRWNPELGIGLCGDWLLGPRVECAWMSGRDLARKI